MSFIILILGIFALPVFYLLARFAGRKQWTAFAILMLCILGGLAFMLRPVCVPIENGEEEAKLYHYEERADRDFYVKVFQKKDGQWRHCKTWISRQFFF